MPESHCNYYICWRRLCALRDTFATFAVKGFFPRPAVKLLAGLDSPVR
jgi:hypothetical protein